MNKEISREEFERWLANQKGFSTEGGRFFVECDADTKEIDPEKRTMVVTISTKTKDRAGDIMEPGGMKFENYKKNPVVLWAHDYKGRPIAKTLWIKVQGDKVIAKPRFANTDLANEVFELYKGGFLNAWSVGFIPEDFEPNKEKQGDKIDGYKVRTWELLEYSAVPVPANPEALSNAYQKGEVKLSPVTVKALGLETKAATWKYCVCKECGYYEEHKAGKPCQEIKCPECGTPLMGSNEKPKTKGVLPYKDLGKEDEGAAWDGPKEVATASVDDLKLMCAWVDPEHADVKQGYKLPHHRASSHKAVWRGVAAAMAALLGARGGAAIPDADKKGVYNHLAKHYKDFDKEAPEFKEYSEEEIAELEKQLDELLKDKPENAVTKPEETETHIHIPVRDADGFVKDSFRTIDISKKQGIQAVIGKLKSDPDGPTKIQKYIFDKSKGWTMEKAKKWVEEHRKGIEYLLGLTDELEAPEAREIVSEAVTDEIKRLSGEIADLKEGRVLSRKNRELIRQCIEKMTEGVAALKKLHDAAEPARDDGKGAESPKPESRQGGENFWEKLLQEPDKFKSILSSAMRSAVDTHFKKITGKVS